MISVIINNHNYGDYIGEAIESVIRQTCQDFELIIVDGASTDRSREVIMNYVTRYPDKITAVFKPTSGQAAAFNVGYSLCRGDIIAMLDSDDYYYETKLERLLQLHKDSLFVGHSRKVTSADGRLVDVVAPIDESEKRKKLVNDFGYVYTYNLIASCISLRRELAEKIFPMPEDGYITFADCYVKVFAQYLDNIKYVNEPLSYYRIHNKQDTQSFDDDVKLYRFVQDLYARVFKDINNKLNTLGMAQIPELTDDNYKRGFEYANPGFIVKKNGKYAIYGTGASSIAYKRVIERLGSQIVCAIDSNQAKWGTEWCGIRIISPDEAIERKEEYEKIVIGSFYYYPEIKKMLEAKGLKETKDFYMIKSFPND